MDKLKKPNKKLQHERELHGWSQARVAEKLGTTVKRVSMWECGDTLPDRYYQEKLCDLFGKNAEELGLIEQQELSEPPQAAINLITSSMQLLDDTTSGKRNTSLLLDEGGYNGVYPREGTTLSLERGETLAVQEVPVVLIPTHQAVDLLHTASDTSLEQKLGALLALEANELATFFDEGWSVEELLATLRVVLPGAQVMSKITRRTFGRTLIRLGVAATVSGIPVPSDRHVSAEDRAKLHDALGKSIASGWKLFHTAGNAQVLAIGQAQLYLVQQSHSILSSRARSRFYTSVYNLIGKAQHFQERYQDALDAHINAHVAAMSTGDPWDAAQSLICQADSYQALDQHPAAMEAIEEALCLIGNPADEGYIRSKAQLLASWTESALAMEEWNTAKEKLEKAADLLDHIQPNEQFDRASWFQLAGKYAFAVGDYHQAVEHLGSALKEVSPTWLVRQALVLLPLIAAHTWEREREASIATAEQAFSVVRALNAPMINKPYSKSLRGLLEAFPNDTGVRTFVAEKLAFM